MRIIALLAASLAPGAFGAVAAPIGFDAAVQAASREAAQLLRDVGDAARNEPAESAACTAAEEGQFRRYTLVIHFNSGRPSVFRKLEPLEQGGRDLAAAVRRLSDADKAAIRLDIQRFLEVEAALGRRAVLDPADRTLARDLRVQYEHVTGALGRAGLDNARWKLFETTPTVASITSNGWFVLRELARASALPEDAAARLRRRTEAGSDGEWRAVYDRLCRAQTGFPRP